MTRLKPCLTCGTLSPDARCAEHNTSGWAAWQGSELPSDWTRIARQVLVEEPTCRCDLDCCPEGCTRPSTECDHIIPRSMGGTHDRANLQGLAGSPCHQRKTHRDQQRLAALRREASSDTFARLSR